MNAQLTSRPRGRTIDALRRAGLAAQAGESVLYLAPNTTMIGWGLKQIASFDPGVTVNVNQRRATFPSGGFVEFEASDADPSRHAGRSDLSSVEFDHAAGASDDWERTRRVLAGMLKR